MVKSMFPVDFPSNQSNDFKIYNPYVRRFSRPFGSFSFASFSQAPKDLKNPPEDAQVTVSAVLCIVGLQEIPWYR
jgi:hypothetical protein